MLGISLADPSHATEIQINKKGCEVFAQLVYSLSFERDQGSSKEEQLKYLKEAALTKELTALTKKLIEVVYKEDKGTNSAQEFYFFCLKNEGRFQVDLEDGV
jgi:hypothetical protein